MERQKFRKFLQIVCPVLIAHLSIFSTIMIADEWDESYENGKAALQRGEWHAADSLFQIALSFRANQREKFVCRFCTQEEKYLN